MTVVPLRNLAFVAHIGVLIAFVIGANESDCVARVLTAANFNPIQVGGFEHMATIRMFKYQKDYTHKQLNLHRLLQQSIIITYIIQIQVILYQPGMDLKRTKDSNKSLNKSHTTSSSKKKRPSSAKGSKPKDQKPHKQHSNIAVAQAFLDTKKKKAGTLVKKKIEDIKNPDLIIKASYRNKKLSIPLSNIGDQGLIQIMTPHITRFEKEILKNNEFDPNLIECWRTINPGDVLKDYYFQTGKSLAPFKGQIIQIQPIWRKPRNNKIRLADFQIIRCIGTGGFSRVFLSRYLPNGKFYALKLMEKEGLLESGKECVVTNERDIMVQLDNPQILRLEFAFETKHFVALALEYCPGGQLFYYLRKVRRMTEDQARYCFVQILMGIQYLHSKKIIYRDIKPQNIMIDMDGNLKIADFGLSKKGIRPSQLAYTFCGSPEYMAPQMLAKSGHTFSVDYYCLGALLYELVTGSPPYYSRDVQKIYFSIQNDQIDFPPHVELSGQIKMLLQGLLIKDPKKRLGSLGGIREILGHPWVRKIKPTDITNKTIQTPIKIDLLTYNINEEEIQQSENNFSGKFKDEDGNFQQLFQDFYFNRYEHLNILEEALPSVKSDSTKQNKSSLNQKIRSSKQKDKLGYKSQQRQQPSYPISFSKNVQNTSPKGFSQIRNIKPKNFNRTNSHKRLDLVVKGRKRDNKSIGKGDKMRNRLLSPKSGINHNKSALKRIKSSAALNQKINNKNNRHN